MKRVMLFGTFDIVHAGHLHLFQQARRYGDEIIVVVARDQTVLRVKGALPFHSEKERQKLLRHIDLIDIAVLGGEKNMQRVIKKYKPDVIALGYDQETFVDEMHQTLRQMDSKVKIVRLKPYRETRYKTGKIKKYIERLV